MSSTGPRFRSVGTDIDFPKSEQQVLAFWREQGVYARSLEQRADGPSFVFFEGPPTANGLPHPGHCLTRVIKDVFPRYRTMRGYRCQRKAGWDTHGLPVEVEVCKELGIHRKEEIEAYGIEPFIQRCQQSVWRYMQQWEQLTERLGFWIDLSEAYVTYHQSYVESVWWSLQQLFRRGLLYRGHKIVWWWAQGGTALSSGEVGQGYRQVADPSVFVAFPLRSEPSVSLLVWTTTPWTLPSNQFAAVHPDLTYAYCYDAQTGQTVVVAEALLETLSEKVKRPLEIRKRVSGQQLVGLTYLPPFDGYYQRFGEATGTLLDGGGQQELYWRVVAADFVTTDSGSGLVHLAPAFGEVDHEVLVAEQARFEPDRGPHLMCAVGPDGRFTHEAGEWAGQWVKDADRGIIRSLRDNGRLWHQEQYLHDYPFCWRAADDPLIQYPRQSWFIRTTAFREAMLENNRHIRWLPEHIRDGRFGKFLESNVDWALSRERFWGTPLPIWVCQQTGQMEAVGSYDELLSKPGVTGTELWQQAKEANPELPEDLKVHKPYIDAIVYDSPFAPGAHMRRVPEVIDCWYDSGAMPFAQWGWPHRGEREFADQFPADFISEALDQTRGWFYSQLAISTMLFGTADASQESTSAASGESETGSDPVANLPVVAYPHPFRNCIVLGLMLAEWFESPDGQQRFLTLEEAQAAGVADCQLRSGKMSKSLRNYRSPQEIFDRYGADALRWYLLANQPPWSSIIYSERAIRDSLPEFLLRLWNVFSFFSIYAEIDGFAGPASADGDLEQLASDKLASGEGYRPIEQRGELDRWLLSEVAITTEQVIQALDAYDSFAACQRLSALVDGLSNWYVRRSRSRFWGEDPRDPAKLDAYWTLYESLTVVAKLIAPCVPFLAERLWQELVSPAKDRCVCSVHLCDYPKAQPEWVDELLSDQMQLLRQIASLGRSARMDAKLKVRQPLERIEVTLVDNRHQAWLEAHEEILKEELNVKQIHYSSGASPYVTYQIQPNFRQLGPRLGKLLPPVKAALAKLDGRVALDQLQQAGELILEIQGESLRLDSADIQVRLQANAGWAAAQGSRAVVALSTELTPSLIQEGWVRDLIRIVQDLRKQHGCHFTQRIRLWLASQQPEIAGMLAEHGSLLMQETLCEQLQRVDQLPDDKISHQQVELGEHRIDIHLHPICP